MIKPTFNAKNRDVWELNPASCIKRERKEVLLKNILQIRKKIAVEMIKQNFVIPSVINKALITEGITKIFSFKYVWTTIHSNINLCFDLKKNIILNG